MTEEVARLFDPTETRRAIGITLQTRDIPHRSEAWLKPEGVGCLVLLAAWLGGCALYAGLFSVGYHLELLRYEVIWGLLFIVVQVGTFGTAYWLLRRWEVLSGFFATSDEAVLHGLAERLELIPIGHEYLPGWVADRFLPFLHNEFQTARDRVLFCSSPADGNLVVLQCFQSLYFEEEDVRSASPDPRAPTSNTERIFVVLLDELPDLPDMVLMPEEDPETQYWNVLLESNPNAERLNWRLESLPSYRYITAAPNAAGRFLPFEMIDHLKTHPTLVQFVNGRVAIVACERYGNTPTIAADDAEWIRELRTSLERSLGWIAAIRRNCGY